MHRRIPPKAAPVSARSGLLVACAAVVLAASAFGARAELVFAEVGADIAATEALTESLAWGDYDGDGDPDLHLAIDGQNRLLRNDGGDRFTDVTEIAEVGDSGWGVGTAFGDLDNDGDVDLYVVNFGPGESDVLYRNDGPVGPGGETVFTNVTPPAIAAGIRSSRGLALLDFDGDGRLDLYVNAIGPDLLYRNLGDLQFAEVATAVGITGVDGQGVGVVATDIDGDGWIDVFTGNRSGDPNRLFRNVGGQFVDATPGSGIDKTGLGMGVLAFDYDNDLDMDLYWTTWPGATFSPTPNALYRNDGALQFVDVATASGTADPFGWGISTNAGDVDLDGFLDFYVSNGFDASSGPNVLFRNEGDGTFSDATSAVGGGAFDGRGVAFADYDNDGDLDLAVTADAGEPNQLWRNDTENGHHWLGLRLVGTASNRSAIGARVEVTTPLRTTVQEVSGGAGRGSQNALPLRFGLGAADTVESITVAWPGGAVETLPGLAVDRYHTVVEVPEPAGVGGALVAMLTLGRLLRRRWAAGDVPSAVDLL